VSNQSNHYSMVIQWSVPDNTYIVTVPELPGCKTHGDTYEEAVRNGQEVIELMLLALFLMLLLAIVTFSIRASIVRPVDLFAFHVRLCPLLSMLMLR
jgi:predicted RNase H-like HicB family nuclease